MPFGTAFGQLARAVREARRFEAAVGQLVISGPEARELATTLAAGGDPAAIAVDGDPLQALVAVRIVDGEPSAAEVATLRRIARAGTPTVVVRLSPGTRLPYVLPEDVVDAGPELSTKDIAAAIAHAAANTAPVLAAALPLLRPAVASEIVRRSAIRNAFAAGSKSGLDAHPQAMALAQSRMLLALRASRGATLPRDPKQLALAVGPSFAAAAGTGIATRALLRALPLRGRLTRAALAYGGTRALGVAGLRL